VRAEVAADGKVGGGGLGDAVLVNVRKGDLDACAVVGPDETVGEGALAWHVELGLEVVAGHSDG